MTDRTTSTSDTVTMAEVHRLLATTEFASVEDLVSQSELVDLRDAPRPAAKRAPTPDASVAVEPGAPLLPRRR
jgi:hypothetical protein